MKMVSAVTSIIILTVMIVSSLPAQDLFFSKYPKPPLYQGITPALFRAWSTIPEKNVFTTSQTADDTTTFTQVPTPFPGVMGGYASWCDFNNDGLMDVFVSGRSDSGLVIKIYRNDGDGIFTDIGANFATLSTEQGMAWGDFDNDGDYDIAVSGNTTTSGTDPIAVIYRNDDGIFTDIGAHLTGLGGGTVTWLDFNNDGLLDLLITGSPNNGVTFAAKLYWNNHGSFKEIPTTLPGVWGSSVDISDYDNDGNGDILLSGWGGTIYTGLFHADLHTDSTVTYTQLPLSLTPITSGTGRWADFNNDGLMDFINVGTGWDHTAACNVMLNSGGGIFHSTSGIIPVQVSAVAVGDYDNDGYVDVAVSGSQDFDGHGNTTRVYHNNQNGTFTDIGVRLPGVWFGSLEWADYDNDGRLDLLMTGGTGGRPYYDYPGPYYPVTLIFHNNIATANQKPSTPGNSASAVSGNAVNFSWDSATDDHTAAAALTYNLRLSSTPSGIDIISPHSHVVTGFHREMTMGNNAHRRSRPIQHLPAGTYYWSVQSIDHNHTGSPFTAEQSFVIGPQGVKPGDAVPDQYSLSAAYPNPFNPRTDVKYAIPEASHIRLAVYDVLGRQVVVLADLQRQPGEYIAQWEPGSVGSGLYFLRFDAHGNESGMNFAKTAKVLYIK